MAEEKGFEIFTNREIETIRLYESPEPIWLIVKALGEIVFLLKDINENLSVLSGFVKDKVRPSV